MFVCKHSHLTPRTERRAHSSRMVFHPSLFPPAPRRLTSSINFFAREKKWNGTQSMDGDWEGRTFAVFYQSRSCIRFFVYIIFWGRSQVYFQSLANKSYFCQRKCLVLRPRTYLPIPVVCALNFFDRFKTTQVTTPRRSTRSSWLGCSKPINHNSTLPSTQNPNATRKGMWLFF